MSFPDAVRVLGELQLHPVNDAPLYQRPGAVHEVRVRVTQVNNTVDRTPDLIPALLIQVSPETEWRLTFSEDAGAFLAGALAHASGVTLL